MPAQKITKEIRCQCALNGAMRAEGLTQTKLGKRLGITQEAVSVRFANAYNMAYCDLVLLGKILHIDIFRIMRECEEKAGDT